LRERDDLILQVMEDLFEGICEHAFAAAESEQDELKCVFHRVIAALKARVEPEALDQVVDSTIQALQNYGGRHNGLLRQQSTEHQKIVGMLTSTLATIGHTEDGSVGRLRLLQSRLEKTSDIEDLRSVKREIGHCLDAIQAEVDRNRQEHSATLSLLKGQLESSYRRSENIDPVTGLPGRLAAEAALAAAGEPSGPQYAVIFVVDRVRFISARFGAAAGDEVLQSFCDNIRKQLLPEDKLYRWSGPALLALLRRPSPIEYVRAEIVRAISQKCESTLKSGHRTLLVPVSGQWSLYSLVNAPRLPVQKLDAFVVTKA
jgi:GGDEF domain-containing protein